MNFPQTGGEKPDFLPFLKNYFPSPLPTATLPSGPLPIFFKAVKVRSIFVLPSERPVQPLEEKPPRIKGFHNSRIQLPFVGTKRTEWFWYLFPPYKIHTRSKRNSYHLPLQPFLSLIACVHSDYLRSAEALDSDLLLGAEHSLFFSFPGISVFKSHKHR